MGTEILRFYMLIICSFDMFLDCTRGKPQEKKLSGFGVIHVKGSFAVFGGVDFEKGLGLT